jgi:hypothetical protein
MNFKTAMSIHQSLLERRKVPWQASTLPVYLIGKVYPTLLKYPWNDGLIKPESL